MQSWDGLRLELLARGYRKILYFELSCPSCSDFRSAYEPDGEFQPACPRCGRAADATILGEGYTRRQTIPWERVSKPTLAAWKTDSDNLTRIRTPRTPSPGRPPATLQLSQHRIAVIAWLALRGASRQAMAEQLGIRKGTVQVFFWRHAAEIEQEQERLRSLSESARQAAVEQARSQIRQRGGHWHHGIGRFAS